MLYGISLLSTSLSLCPLPLSPSLSPLSLPHCVPCPQPLCRVCMRGCDVYVAGNFFSFSLFVSMGKKKGTVSSSKKKDTGAKKSRPTNHYCTKITAAQRAAKHPGVFEDRDDVMWCICCNVPVRHDHENFARAHIKGNHSAICTCCLSHVPALQFSVDLPLVNQSVSQSVHQSANQSVCVFLSRLKARVEEQIGSQSTIWAICGAGPQHSQQSIRCTCDTA